MESRLLKQSCFLQNELYPRLVQDVQLMINELGNVTVLWEELWLSTLQDLHSGSVITLDCDFVFHNANFLHVYFDIIKARLLRASSLLVLLMLVNIF